MKEWKRFVIEIGTGIDQHGQDSTKACIKAIKDAISRVYLIGLVDMNFEETKVTAKIGVPHPENVDVEKVKDAFPVKSNLEIEVVQGGLSVSGAIMKEFGDKNPEILIAIASITVYVKG